MVFTKNSGTVTCEAVVPAWGVCLPWHDKMSSHCESVRLL